ncbi:hypothetical protein [Halorientalis sp.]|nr:hypothetical protein [Halorientalis sp.]
MYRLVLPRVVGRTALRTRFCGCSTRETNMDSRWQCVDATVGIHTQ